MKKIKELLAKQNGNILVLVAVAFTGLLGIAGLAIDGGNDLYDEGGAAEGGKCFCIVRRAGITIQMNKPFDRS